jgi:uncharacterized protein YecE (DUF72 family)
MENAGRIRIGTSNTVVPGNKSSFPPAYQLGSRLHYYSSLFDTVEVNSCFYKTPQASTYARWAQDVPEDFQFTIKLSKEITHAKDLKGDLSCMEKFMQNASSTGNKKGCLLVQFPGKITLDHFNEVEKILEELGKHDPSRAWKTAVEFRHPSWHTGETWELLDEFGATMVLQDMPKARIFERKGNADFVYVRFHGPTGNYRGSYSRSFLEEKAAEISGWSDEGKEVYVYFNNTAGDAFENARSLQRILHLPRAG